MTHAELVERAGAWLRRNGCGMVFTELVSLQTEIPDAIGWRSQGAESFLIECKTSRSDFLADRRKGFRREPERGMGRYRYILCPPGLVRTEELPARWGLLYCHPKTIELVHGKHPRKWDDGSAFWHAQVNLTGELKMFYSALARLRADLGEARFRDRVHLPYMDRQRELRAKAA